MTKLGIGLHISIGSIGQLGMKSQLSWISAADSNCISIEPHWASKRQGLQKGIYGTLKSESEV